MIAIAFFHLVAQASPATETPPPPIAWVEDWKGSVFVRVGKPPVSHLLAGSRPLRSGPVERNTYLYCASGGRATVRLQNGKLKIFEKQGWVPVPITGARRKRVGKALSQVYEVGGRRSGGELGFWFPLKGVVRPATFRAILLDQAIESPEHSQTRLRLFAEMNRYWEPKLATVNIRSGDLSSAVRPLLAEWTPELLRLEVAIGDSVFRSAPFRILSKGDEEELRADLRELAGAQPHSVGASIMRSGIFLGYDLKTDAAMELERALDRYPNDRHLWTILRNVYRRANLPSGADNCTRKLAILDGPR